MKIYIANLDLSRTGGGWTFTRNFEKGMGDLITNGYENDYQEADIYFIPGATMVSREEVQKAKADGKKIVLRLDNALRNSNNRGTGMSRMKDFCEMADLVIYQSQWAKNFLKPFTGKDGVVILNGVDKTIYNNTDPLPGEETYLYARSSRDESKGWIMAWYWFVTRRNIAERQGYPWGRPVLEIAGKFSPENREYNFDFYSSEQFVFTGYQPNLIDAYKRNRCFLYTYLNDACSNTLLEARAMDMSIIDVYGMLQTGGAPEIMACEDISLERMCNEYKLELEKL
ncbi:MAG: hypothetical protein EPO02_13485 [Nitrospirae bacterium]|nr:MAG: hypothetical protein EPO02_13485 [Nitrospirota bacterium]